MERRWQVMLFLLILYVIGYCRSDLPFRKKYDYVVVGAGSSGATVASRLSEENWATVLLLEAGGQPLPITEVPYQAFTLLSSTPIWPYVTEPQTHSCQGLVGKRIQWGRGKSLGGSSTVNFMMYVRGNKRDYDHWAEEGCTGWGYEDVLPFFKKSEDNRIPGIAEDGYHGVSGNLTVSYPNYVTPLRRTIIEAGKLLGYKEVDYNGAHQTGFSVVQGTLRDGRRCSTEKAFLRVSRPNLDIVEGAFVTKIQFDEEKRARSVVFERENVTHTVQAGREIIISAGVINTPQLLMLSGIGPKEHLQEIGVPVVADLQGVGANLQDHTSVDGMIYHINQPISLLSSRVVTEKNFKLFSSEGKGPLTVPAAIETTAFVHTKYADPGVDYPDIQLGMLSTSTIVTDKAEKFEQDYNTILQEDAVTIKPLIMRPKSRGFVKLRSQDPHVYPVIDPRYLAEEDDLKILIEGMRIIHNLTKTKPFRDLGAEIRPRVMPACKDHELWSDDYLACWARTFTTTFNHAVGTCKMGNPNDPMTVVDPELKVKGVTGLRIADSSVLPYLVSGNTNAACIMIGEKMADIIKRT